MVHSLRRKAGDGYIETVVGSGRIKAEAGSEHLEMGVPISLSYTLKMI